MIEKGILKMLVSENWEIGKRIQTRYEGVLGKHRLVARKIIQKIMDDLAGTTARKIHYQRHTQTNKQIKPFSVPILLDLLFIFIFFYYFIFFFTLARITPFYQTVNASLNSEFLFSAPFDSPFFWPGSLFLFFSLVCFDFWGFLCYENCC